MTDFFHLSLNHYHLIFFSSRRISKSLLSGSEADFVTSMQKLDELIIKIKGGTGYSPIPPLYVIE
jgi:hypothetical protein